jgi:hypothetical protein
LAAADTPPAGTWKVSLPLLRGAGARPLWLIQLEEKDGKWSGTVTATADQWAPATITNLSVGKDLLRFTFKMQEISLPCEVGLPKDNAAKLYGSASLRGNVVPLELEKTTVKGLDSLEMSRELLSKQTIGWEVVMAAMMLLQQAEKKMAKPEEVRGWATKAVKAAEPYGMHWQSDVVLDIAEILGSQKGYETIALQYARQAERMLDPKERPVLQKRVLEVLANALTKAGKADDAKEIEARLKKLDFKIKPELYAGRKGKSDRVVLVELFTGAQCPPCVAADLAFDNLEKTFKPAEVILLQYHLHVPGPDPLTSPASELRAKFYGETISGTPTILFNGKPGAPGGGDIADSPEKYAEYVATITPQLETPAKAQIKASATRKGDQIDITAEVSGLKDTGDDIRLRFALVEEQVDYTGGNKLPSHHHVVRALPGGPDGTALKEKTAKKTVSVNLSELRKELNDYLDKSAARRPFPNKERPLELKKLYVVAFVQNDDNGEVFQAIQVEVKGG